MNEEFVFLVKWNVLGGSHDNFVGVFKTFEAAKKVLPVEREWLQQDESHWISSDGYRRYYIAREQVNE